mmetsp:Transcript_63195/g.206239  ORF Transcript_63195/g.206239 Transcript_63195/m.206239 type:complete len:302 (+) Transcript_63195:294-1199(+)
MQMLEAGDTLAQAAAIALARPTHLLQDCAGHEHTARSAGLESVWPPVRARSVEAPRAAAQAAALGIKPAVAALGRRNAGCHAAARGCGLFGGRASEALHGAELLARGRRNKALRRWNRRHSPGPHRSSTASTVGPRGVDEGSSGAAKLLRAQPKKGVRAVRASAHRLCGRSPLRALEVGLRGRVSAAGRGSVSRNLQAIRALEAETRTIGVARAAVLGLELADASLATPVVADVRHAMVYHIWPQGLHTLVLALEQRTVWPLERRGRGHEERGHRRGGSEKRRHGARSRVSGGFREPRACL